jgi:tetratricopeptide (TPR) repeat protein
MKSEGLKSGILLSLITSLVSLSFLDPINWPKQIALATFAPYILFLAWSAVGQTIKLSLFFKILFAGYFISGFLAAITSQSSVVRVLWGTFGRNNGLVTYISLGLIMMSGFYIAKSKVAIISILIPFISALVIAGFYGIAQKLYLDPIKWSQDGQAFSFFGNINFASALFSLGAMSCLALSLLKEFKVLARFILLFLSSFFLAMVYLTDSVQGILMFAIAGVLYLFILVQQKSSILSKLFLLSASLSGIFIFWSFLGQGPLGEYLYQYTLKLRFYYILSGILMGLENLPFGVGIDSYGDYYREVRPNQVIDLTGIDITVNNSHSSIIQIFATLGLPATIFLLMAYLYATRNALYLLLRKEESRESKFFIAIFIALTINSLFSIDNISIAVWNFLFLGIALGLNREMPERIMNSQVDKKIVKRVKQDKGISLSTGKTIATFLSISTFIFSWASSYPERKIVNVFQQAGANYSNEERVNELVEISKSVMTRDQDYRYVAEALSTLGVNDLAIVVLREGIKKFPKEYQLYDYLSVFLERANRKDEAIIVRQDQLKLDPNHPRIWLYYAFDLADVGRKNEALAAFQEVLQRKAYLSSEELSKLPEYEARIRG